MIALTIGYSRGNVEQIIGFTRGRRDRTCNDSTRGTDNSFYLRKVG